MGSHLCNALHLLPLSGFNAFPLYTFPFSLAGSHLILLLLLECFL
jgi:hypothetical protein